jgi:hypothetical protein
MRDMIHPIDAVPALCGAAAAIGRGPERPRRGLLLHLPDAGDRPRRDSFRELRPYAKGPDPLLTDPPSGTGFASTISRSGFVVGFSGIIDQPHVIKFIENRLDRYG